MPYRSKKKARVGRPNLNDWPARPAYEKSVFINCPFDSEYRDLMLASVFSVSAHGFVPRSAREAQADAEPRFSRILAIIAASKYSIHDLSRFTGEGGENLARFNMPLELRMAAAFRFERDGSSRPHQWLALVPEGYAYQRYVSDLAGFDPSRHDSSVPAIIREVSTWLSTLDDVLDPVPSALRILQSFPSFRAELANLRKEALEKETWTDVVLAASKCTPEA
jgi:hypothetical protein